MDLKEPTLTRPLRRILYKCISEEICIFDFLYAHLCRYLKFPFKYLLHCSNSFQMIDMYYSRLGLSTNSQSVKWTACQRYDNFKRNIDHNRLQEQALTFALELKVLFSKFRDFSTSFINKFD